MRRSKIEGSSNVAEIGYDEQTQTLQVMFHNGGVYNYADVSPQQHSECMAAKSKGSFLARNIKGQCECERVE